MPDFNKGDFTQQGVNGHVNATVRLNEKRLVNIDLTSNEEAEGCTITGRVTDLLNNVTYNVGGDPPPAPYDIFGKDAELIETKDYKMDFADTDWASWTPSTTSHTLAAAESDFITTTRDPDYDYVLLMDTHIDYQFTVPNTVRLIRNYYMRISRISATPKTSAQVQNGPPFTGVYVALDALTGMSVRRTSGGVSYRNSFQSYGFYHSESQTDLFTVTDSAISVIRPAINVVCSNNYLSTTAAPLLDTDATNISIHFELYKVARENSVTGHYVDTLYTQFKEGL